MSDVTVEAPKIEDLNPLFINYDIEELIAVGGMGAVYKGIQISLDRRVAIKILPKQFGQNPEFCAQFEKEAKVMAKVSHPNLLGVLDFGNIEGLLYIVMEYAGRGSVHDATYRSDITEEDKIDLIIQASKGIAHAHEMGMIHRDIKPANMLIDENNTVKVADFGLAKEQGHDSENEEIWGTPGFTAPEVLDGPNRASIKSDIFSLGGSLYYLLFKKDPDIDGVKITQLRDLDAKLSAIIVRCMASDPSRRYDNALSLAEDLEEYKKSFNPDTVKGDTKAMPLLQRGNSSPLLTGNSPATNQNNLGVQGANTPVKLKSNSNGVSLFIPVVILALVVGGVFFFINNKEKSPKENPIEVVNTLETLKSQKVVLKNNSFEQYKKTKGNQNLIIFDDWKFYLANKEAVIKKAKAEGLDGETGVYLKSASIEQEADSYVEKGMLYELNILLAKRTDNEVKPQKDFKILFLVGDLLLKSVTVLELNKIPLKEGVMTNYSFSFLAKNHSPKFKTAPLKIKIISKKRAILVDNVSLIVRPIKPEEY